MRLPKVYRTPPSQKQKNIAAFGRLLEKAVANGYRGQRLDDQTPEKLAKCVALWLSYEGYKSRVTGCTVTIPFSDGDMTIECAGSHRTDPSYPEPIATGEYEVTIWNLLGFETWFNENLKAKNDEQH